MVNVNGDIIGLTRAPKRFVTAFRKMRRAGRINEFVSIYTNMHHKIVYIACDSGRICRPMIVVDNMRPRVTDEHIKVRLSYSCLSSKVSNETSIAHPIVRIFPLVP